VLSAVGVPAANTEAKEVKAVHGGLRR